jgi:uncharacterized protein YcnI
MNKIPFRAGAVFAGLAAACLLAPTAAAAHVTVNPREATQGGYGKLTFRVPNERPDATTSVLEVSLPPDTPIPSVSVKPLSGWTVDVTRTTLATPVKTEDREITEAVTKIVWTANNPQSHVQVGQFQEFDISAGPLPKVDKMVFKALQTYSSGEVVRWIEEPASDGKQPDHPAPVLKLLKPATSTPAAAPVSMVTTDNGRANVALGLGITALVVALLGLGVAILGVRRRAASSPTSGPQ